MSEENDTTRRRTLIRTLRIDEDIDNALVKEAERAKLTVNVVANQVLTKWAHFDRYVARYNLLGISRRIFSSMMRETPDDSMARIGKESGEKMAKMLLVMAGKPCDTSIISNYFLKEVLSGYEKWYMYESHLSGSCEKFVLRHDLGYKWSLFLKEYIKAALMNCLEMEVQVNAVDETIEFSLPL